MRKKLLLMLIAVLMLLNNCFLAEGILCLANEKSVVAEECTVNFSYTVEKTLPMFSGGSKLVVTRDDGWRNTRLVNETNTTVDVSVSLKPGVYTIKLERDGYLENIIENIVVDNRDLDLGNYDLTCGDVNNDGVVDKLDLIVARRFLGKDNIGTDLNGDGTTDLLDTIMIAQNYTKTTTPTEYTNITDLLCDMRPDPLGIDIASPYLSWKLSSTERGQKQTAFRIVVSSSLENFNNGNYDVWDYTEESSSMGLNYAGPALTPRSEYFWTVFVTDKDGDIIAPNTVARFETALFGDFGDDNHWISAENAAFQNTTATLKIDMTLDNTAVGVTFCQSDDYAKYLMWQINVSTGKVMFRPHYYTGSGWGLFAEKDISDIFPSVKDCIGVPFVMTIKTNNGTIETYINDTLIHTLNNPTYVGRIGAPELYLGGAEKGTISWKLYDENNNFVHSRSQDKLLPYCAQVFRKSFDLNSSAAVEKARLYVTAAGCHEMYMNGKRCSDDYLAPGKSDYVTELYYQTYDVTDILLSGENTIAGQVGIGWYNGGPIGSSYGTNLGLKAKLIVTYADGTEQVVDTDESWLSTKDGPVTVNRLYTGQTIDSRKNIDKWNENGSQFAGWGKVKVNDSIGIKLDNLVGENTMPIRAIREVHPIEVTNPAEKVFVYKFPTNMAGTVRVTASAPKDTAINFKYAEMLTASGYADISWMCPYEGGDQNGRDNYIFSGTGEETFEFSLVFHGFQYMEVTGLDEAIPLENITGIVLSTDSERIGYFESSNELLTKYVENTVRSQESNFMGAIMDCPSREKNNWTGDAQGFSSTGTYLFNCYNIYRGFQEMTLSVQNDNGVVPEIVPLGGIKSPDATKTPSAWSDCIIIIPWNLYNQYGNDDILEMSYDGMKKWADYLIRTCADDNYVRLDGWYGDHVPVDRRLVDGEGLQLVGTAFSSYSIGILSKIANILGETEDAAYYKSESEKFAAAWRNTYLLEDGITCKIDAQSAYVMGIYFNLYDTEEKKQLASDHLAKLIREGNPQLGFEPDCMTVGFIGFPLIQYALSRYDNLDEAFTILEQTKYPSILYPVTQGATTTWEHYAKEASLNHFMSGSFTAWIFSDLVGISHEYAAENAGYRHFVLRPTYGGSLTHVKGSLDSQSGLIKSEWKLSDDGKVFTYDCTVPANTSATLMLPVESENAIITEGGKDISLSDGVVFVKYENGRAIYEITSGVYHFVVTNK